RLAQLGHDVSRRERDRLLLEVDALLLAEVACGAAEDQQGQDVSLLQWRRRGERQRRLGGAARDPTRDLFLAGLVDRGDVELRIGRSVAPEDDAALVDLEATALEGVVATLQADLAGDVQRLPGGLAEVDVSAQLDLRVVGAEPGV